MNKLFLIVALSFSYSFVMSQNLEYGVKGGLNLSSLHNEGSNFDEYETMVGLVIGGYGTMRFNEKNGIKVELLYSMEGANIKGSDKYVRLNRVSIPLLFNYRLTEKINIEAGPEFKFQVGFDSNVPSSQGDIESLYETLDYGGSLGIEFRAFEKIGFSLRNYFGLKHHSQIDLRDQFANRIDLIKTDRSNVFSFSINYYLN